MLQGEGSEEQGRIAVLFEVRIDRVLVRVGADLVVDVQVAQHGEWHFEPAVAGVGVECETWHFIILG